MSRRLVNYIVKRGLVGSLWNHSNIGGASSVFQENPEKHAKKGAEKGVEKRFFAISGRTSGQN